MADDFVMEERKEFMVSPTGGYERRRTAHFLKPCAASTDGAAAAPSLDSSGLSADGVEKYRDLPLRVNFVGWSRPTKNWKNWVQEMSSAHRSTWETAGILDAIMSSTITIHRHSDLVFEFVEKWCPTTNTFVFRWGEATLTLEDMAILGGFAVLGDWVLSRPEDGETQEVVNKLVSALSSLNRSKSKKARLGSWMIRFMGSRSKIEHEAFLAYWLSGFVFPSRANVICKNVLSIAARLARGTKMALAPAVLASIYKSMSLLKAGVIATRKCGAKGGLVDVTVLGPLALVQVWIWERFPSLRPNPKSIQPSEPRLAQWDSLKKQGIENLSLTIHSAAKEFLWRPYTSDLGNRFLAKIYKDSGYWTVVNSSLDVDLEGLIHCVRASELVGVEADCIEPYLPHRVAMQFGMDQDIPGHVARVNVNPQIAWNDYTRPIRDRMLYVPSPLSEPQCTARYLNWWRKLYQGQRGIPEPEFDQNCSSVLPNVAEMKNLGGIKLEDDMPPPGFSPKWTSAATVKPDNSIVREVSHQRSPLSSAAACTVVKHDLCKKSSTLRRLKRKFDDSSNRKISDFYDSISPPGFPRKRCKRSHSSTATQEPVVEVSSVGSPENDEPCDENQGRDNLSSTADNLNIEDAVEPAESEVKAHEESGVLDAGNTDGSPGQVQTSPGLLQLEGRIRNLERLVTWFKSGVLPLTN